MARQTHRSRFLTALFALGVLLFAQLALAGYHCAGAGSASRQLAVEAAVPCAEHMAIADEEARGLCHAHCQVAQQKVDGASPVPAVTLQQLATGLTVEPAGPPGSLRPQRRAWRPASGPPLSIRNCCFRI